MGGSRGKVNLGDEVRVYLYVAPRGIACQHYGKAALKMIQKSF